MDIFDEKIIGYSAVKDTLRQLLSILQNKSDYEARGASLPHGLLMTSEPGLGKSTLAEIFMKESKRYSLIFHKDSDNESFLESLREAFSIAKENVPSVFLLEDIHLYGDSQYAPAWATLQACIDDVKDDDIFIIATANETRYIPDSLLRPGRFDYAIHLEAPTGDLAERIAAYYLRECKLADDVVIADVVRAMGGNLSCATLETVMNLASINSCYRGSEKINKEDLTDAILQLIYQLPKSDYPENEDVEQIALHEAAHAVAAEVLQPSSVSLVTLRSNARRMGMTQYYRDKQITTETELLSLAVKSLAGKAGAEMVYGHLDMGASDDIQTALEYVHQWVEVFAGNGFAGVVFDRKSLSEDQYLRNETLAAAKMEELYREARSILHEHYDFLMAVQKALLERETLLGSDIAVIKNHFQPFNTTANNASGKNSSVL